MHNMMRLACLAALNLIATVAFSQAEFAPWGNMQGIRIEGQLFPFETAIGVTIKNKTLVTGKELQRPVYQRNGQKQVVTTEVNGVAITKTVEDKGDATADISIVAKQGQGNPIDSLFVLFYVPLDVYGSGVIQADERKALSLSSARSAIVKYVEQAISSLIIGSADQKITIVFDKATRITFRGVNNNALTFLIPVETNTNPDVVEIHKSFRVKVTGKVTDDPVSIAIDHTRMGNTFDGFGGNFRLQNPVTDPQVIDYCLKNMRVAWGRVEMPWRFWHPQKADDPISLMKAGKLDERVKNAMLMAQRLSRQQMPVILSAWSGPNWAIVGEPRFRPTPEGVWGNPLNMVDADAIYKSIADYIIYLRDEFNVEIAMFSFNESDLGINIRMTGSEHADFIKGFGAYLKSRGLKTKLLLGDNSDATTISFIEPALNDPAALPYIGAVSFHSWRGWETSLLQQWADAAKKINLPLIIGEGSIDAQAWGYPQIFLEPGYALDEINLYIRLLAICQPASILQWQLTADYSPLAGGGIFGDNSPLRPTQRFWNLKQLASVPEGLKAVKATSDNPTITVAALSNKKKDKVSIHIVNNGTQRVASLTGLPKSVKALRVIVTNRESDMKEKSTITVSNGKASIALDERSYILLSSM